MGIRKLSSILLVLQLFVAPVAIAPYAHAKGVDPEERVEYYLYDHLGGVDMVLDEQGNVVERRDYLPFGEERVADGASNERHGFTGKELDDESGLYYFGARNYDPTIGRFTSMDPLALSEAGKSIQSILTNPQELNGHAYARNNPLRFIDPTGMITKDGIVEKGDTLGGITKTLNSANGTHYSILDVARLNSIQNPDKIFVGQKLIPNNATKDVTSALNKEINRCVEGLSEHKNKGITDKFLIFKDYSTDPEKMNLKVRPNSVFNIAENQRQDYVFEGEKIRYDSPANILYGYVGKYFGYDSTTLTLFAGLYQIKSTMSIKNGIGSPNYGDDPIDTGYIMKGVNMFINPTLQPK